MDEAQLRRLMGDDEGEGLEFKSALLSRKEIAEYAVGIGNEGGGWLVMGISDRRPRPIVGIEEQSAADLQKVRDSVMDAAGIASSPSWFTLRTVSRWHSRFQRVRADRFSSRARGNT